MKLTYLTLAAALLLAGPAMADGGGGGSMGSSGAAPSASREDPTAAYQAGVTALNAQNYREAIRQLRDARRAAPNDGAINYALGVAYIGAGEANDARSALERAVRASNAPAGAHWQLGMVYLQLDRRDDAMAQQAALQERISECDASCGDQRRGELQTALDQLTQALAAPTAPAADPATTGWNFPSVEEGRAAYADAVGLINQERYADAFHALTRAEAAVGPHPDVLNYMGFVSRKMGRFDAALDYYQAALAIDPNHLVRDEYLGELFLQMGDMDRAERQLARLDDLCAYGCEQREELARWIESFGTVKRIAVLAALIFVSAAAPSQIVLREQAWTAPGENMARAMLVHPGECAAARTSDTEIGRTLFRAPALLGGQAARAGLSCNACHSNGRVNAHFLLPELTDRAGFADVTSEWSSHLRGDGVENPVAIPDLAGAGSREAFGQARDPSLDHFVRGVIIEEFESEAMTEQALAGVVAYVRAMNADACAGETAVTLASAADDVRRAVTAAETADAATARLLVLAAQDGVGRIVERLPVRSFRRDRGRFERLSRELGAMRHDDVHALLAAGAPAWRGRFDAAVARVARRERQTYFNEATLRTALPE